MLRDCGRDERENVGKGTCDVEDFLRLIATSTYLSREMYQLS